jgi:hypothetical protein
MTGAGVLRRFGAMLYDFLVVLALGLVMTALFLPFTGGEAITPQDSGVLEYIYRARRRRAAAPSRRAA